MVDGFVDLDTPLFQILFQKVMNAQKLDAFIRIPFLQTKPGRIVSVPSFGQDQVFTLHFLVVLDDSPDNLFHRLIVAGERDPS